MRSERSDRDRRRRGLLLAAGCSEPESFIVLTLRTPDTTPATTITDVANIRVKVSKGTTELGVFIYEAHGATIDQSSDNTLSVGFSRQRDRQHRFRGRRHEGRRRCSIGRGTATKQIKKGGTAFVDVTLAPGMNCSIVDGGAPDAPEGGTLPGCDPVNPQSTAAGVTTCTATQTCQVDCLPPMNAAPRNECIAGGTGAAGTRLQHQRGLPARHAVLQLHEHRLRREGVPALLQRRRGVHVVRRGRRRPGQLLRGPGHVPQLPDRVPHLHVQLRPARDAPPEPAAAAPTCSRA